MSVVLIPVLHYLIFAVLNLLFSEHVIKIYGLLQVATTMYASLVILCSTHVCSFSELCIVFTERKPPSRAINVNEANATPVDGNQYGNIVVVALSQDKHGGSKDTRKDRSQPLYEDLNVGTASAETPYYEEIKPPAAAKKL